MREEWERKHCNLPEAPLEEAVCNRQERDKMEILQK